MLGVPPIDGDFGKNLGMVDPIALPTL